MSKPTNDVVSYSSDIRINETARIINERVSLNKKLPLEVIFEAMDNFESLGNIPAAAALAVQAAPYVHPKLKDVMLVGGGADGAPVKVDLLSSLKGLTRNELSQLETLIEKGLTGKAPPSTPDPQDGHRLGDQPPE